MDDAFGLYLILTDPAAGYECCAEAAVAEGVRFLQLRMKDSPRDAILKTARSLRSITHGTSTLLIINDDVGIAREVDADGVHLGQEDMALSEARELWPDEDKIFGLSTHNEEQAADACTRQPSYIGVGPVFPTPTKKNPDPVLGLERMAEIIHSSSLCSVAIGGINSSNLSQVLRHGARNFAVVRDVNKEPNPRSAIAELMRIWRGCLK